MTTARPGAPAGAGASGALAPPVVPVTAAAPTAKPG